jgi:lysozyme family protein
MADFNLAVAITFRPDHEGGYQCLPNDKGNWTGGQVGVGALVGTNHGISAAEFPLEDIKNMTIERAMQIYQKEYWNPLYSQIESQDFANKLFDIGVMSGVGTSVKLAQGLFKDLNMDGHFGPVTLSAINSSEPVSLLVSYKTVCVTHAVALGAADPNERPFVADWIKRINF